MMWCVAVGLKEEGIEPLHCKVELREDSTALHALQGTCYVNRIAVKPGVPAKLSHGGWGTSSGVRECEVLS